MTEELLVSDMALATAGLNLKPGEETDIYFVLRGRYRPLRNR